MDNLCHTLAGAALADAGLKHRTPRGMSTLLVASNLPDIDVLVFATNTLPMSFRRGWTHGVLALAVLPAAFAVLMYGVDRLRGRESRAHFGWLLALSYIGTWLHVFMDFLNSYGIRLLMPFSERWFYGDALYIVDPILYALFGGAIALGRLRTRIRRQNEIAASAADLSKRGRPFSFPLAGFALAAVYMLAMLGSNTWARAAVHAGLTRAGQPADTRFMVTPVFANPFKREVIIDVGGRYEKGFVWFQPAPHFRPAGYGVNVNADDPLARQAAATPTGQAYLRWSRFPFFVVQQTGAEPRVQLNDYRYAGPGGRETWLSVTVHLPSPRGAPIQ